MDHGLHRSLTLLLVSLSLVLAGGACKSAPGPEAPVTSAPSFESSGKPAERVDETTGFKESQPSEGMGDSGSSADKLNAQNRLKRV